MEILDSLAEFLAEHPSKPHYQHAKMLFYAKQSQFRHKELSDDEYVVYVPLQKSRQSVQVYFNNESELFISCPCPEADSSSSCPHAVAAAIYLQEYLLKEDGDEIDAMLHQTGGGHIGF